MADLYPTPTRLALLRDVNEGQVVFSTYDNGVLNLAYSPPRKVLAETAQMRDAGWIVVDWTTESLGSYHYALTDAGRAVLDAHPEADHG